VKSPSPQKKKNLFFLSFFLSFFFLSHSISIHCHSLSPTPTQIYSTPALKSPRRFTQIINHTLPLIFILSLTFTLSFFLSFFLSLSRSLSVSLSVTFSLSFIHILTLIHRNSHCQSLTGFTGLSIGGVILATKRRYPSYRRHSSYSSRRYRRRYWIYLHPHNTIWFNHHWCQWESGYPKRIFLVVFIFREKAVCSQKNP
jgi:hypothetical protein